MRNGIDFNNATYILKTVKENRLFENNNSTIQNIKTEVIVGNNKFSKTANQTYHTAELADFTLGALKLKNVNCITVNDNYVLDQQNSKLKFNYTNKYYYIFDKNTNEYIGSISFVDRIAAFLETEYKFIDINNTYLAKNGINYSSLKETQQKYSPELLTISPNPSSNNVTFHFSINNDTKLTLQIFDLNGRLIINVIADKFYNEGEYTYKEDVSELPSGNYLVKLISPTNLLTSKLSIVK